jgi:hypothetical protein
MKEKALMLIGLHSRKWLSDNIGINPITLDKRILKDNWKNSEILILEKIYQEEKSKL